MIGICRCLPTLKNSLRTLAHCYLPVINFHWLDFAVLPPYLNGKLFQNQGHHKTHIMTKINPYLNFHGNAEEAFQFYKAIFGGDFITVMRFKDMGDDGRMSEEDKNKIAHIALPIGGNILMGSDALESYGQKFQAGNNFYVSLTTETKEEADRLYNSLSAKGEVEMAIGDAPWGAYFGMFKDKFDVRWMISFERGK